MRKVKQAFIGETAVSCHGQVMTVTNYRNFADIDIRFDDGTVVSHKRMDKFRQGLIKNPNATKKNFYLGKSITATNGQKMTIVGFRDPTDIDVLFEDGTLVEHKGASNFNNGRIRNPNFNPTQNKYIGEKVTATNGQVMTILAYRGKKDIDIIFEDGTIVEHKTLTCFQSGQIRNPNIKRRYCKLKEVPVVGETITAKNGRKMTIVAYRKITDIDVKFEDGTIVKHKPLSDIMSGRVGNPNYAKNRHNTSYQSYIGETVTANNGQEMTIIAYRGPKDIDVRFDDGTVVEHKALVNFKRGGIKNPSTQKSKIFSDLFSNGSSPDEICKKLGMKRSTFYNYRSNYLRSVSGNDPQTEKQVSSISG